MEHSVPSLHLVRPWRAAALVATAVAGFELLVIVLAGAALLGRPVAREMRTEASERVLAPRPARKAKRPAAGAPVLTRRETSVLVLNGNGRTGAAASTAAQVDAMGYIIGSVGNANRADYGRSVVMYRRGRRAEAARLARDLRIKLVSPLDGLKPAQLLGAHVAVVIGHDR